MENKEAFLKQIGENIKEIRRQKKVEVKDIASNLDISVQAYGRIENGKTDVNISRLFQISKFFEVSFSKILKIENSETFNFTSQQNSGGYHVLNNGVINITDEKLHQFLQSENNDLKKRLNINETILSKLKK
jgi:transcriptional regulator with XRE-family HTH domain